jgi:hypothetical protein
MKIGTQSPSVAAVDGSHCEAIVIFAGCGFDLRLALDAHGSARDDYFGKRLGL